MCGRASLALDEDELAVYLHSVGVPAAPARHPRRYNIPPQDDLLLFTELEGHRRDARMMQWGLVPFWAKDPSIGRKLSNARAETVATKPAFRSAFRKRRGLIVVDGFFEWHRHPNGSKTPMRIAKPDNSPFTLAGLWETWGEGDKQLITCTVITTTPNDLMAPIHDRMPVILTGDAQDAWLDPTATVGPLQDLLIPDWSNTLHAYEVSPLVNHPSNDNIECWRAATSIDA